MSRGEAERVKKMDNAKTVDVKVSLYIYIYLISKESRISRFMKLL